MSSSGFILIIGCSEAEIYLFGGCITSWKVASGKDLLFVRPDAVFNKIKPIRFVSELQHFVIKPRNCE